MMSKQEKKQSTKETREDSYEVGPYYHEANLNAVYDGVEKSIIATAYTYHGVIIATHYVLTYN